MTLTPDTSRKPRDDEMDVFGVSHVGKVRQENQVGHRHDPNANA